MKPHITALTVSACLASAASAQVLLDETFNYSLTDGATMLSASINDPAGGTGNWFKTSAAATFFFEETSLDATGGAGRMSNVANSVALQFTALPSQAAGAVTAFSFLLDAANTGFAYAGNRIMFESFGTSSNFGYGINFDVSATGAVTAYSRVGTFNNTSTPPTFTGPALITGTFTRTGQFAGDLVLEVYQGAGFTSLVGSQTTTGGTWLGGTATGLTPTAVLRLNDTTDATYVVDALRFQTVPVPEPSTYAMLAGLGAIGLVALRRRKS